MLILGRVYWRENLMLTLDELHSGEKLMFTSGQLY
jgi:hypothetical protein